MMMTSGAAPCLSCGTTGGHQPPGYRRPSRSRGLCHTCVVRAYSRGCAGRYPACGAVPVPYVGHTWSLSLVVPPPLTPEEFGRFLVTNYDEQTRLGRAWGHAPFGAPPEALPARWQGCPPRLASAPTATLNPDAHRRIVQAERDAAAWLAERGREAA